MAMIGLNGIRVCIAKLNPQPQSWLYFYIIVILGGYILPKSEFLSHSKFRDLQQYNPPTASDNEGLPDPGTMWLVVAPSPSLQNFIKAKSPSC